MPWYTNPIKTCKVLNRIATRYPRANIQDLKTTLDNATQLLWRKQERFCNRTTPATTGSSWLNSTGN